VPSRRELLGAVATASAATAAGCSGSLPFAGADGGRPDLYLCNEHDEPVEYDLELRRTTGDTTTLVDDSGRLDVEDGTGSDDCVYYENPVTEPGTYTLAVTPSLPYDVTVFWDEPREPATHSADPDGIGITLHSDSYLVDHESNRAP
jgi:hypothetical protein